MHACAQFLDVDSKETFLYVFEQRMVFVWNTVVDIMNFGLLCILDIHPSVKLCAVK